MAQTINTIPQWNGTSFINPWGVPNTATYGQTFTPTSNMQSFLNSFTFELFQQGGTPPQYQAFVYQFDPTTKLIVGPALFSSAVLTAPNSAAFTPVTINTGRVQLVPGTQYVIMFTTSTIPGQASASYRWGSLTTDTAVPNGQFVFENNGANFNNLFINPWSNIAEDLAFSATFGLPLLVPALQPNAAQNPTNVARLIDNFTLNLGGTPTPGFFNLYNLNGQALSAALTQLDGEIATQTRQGAYRITNSFLNLLLSPLTDFRPGGFGPIASLPDSEPSLSNSYAQLGGPLPPTGGPVRNYDVWGAAYGSHDHIGGNTTVGSNASSNQNGGFAVGLDYRAIPNTVFGVAVGGGGQNWSLVNGLGTGGSDILQAGAYASANFGPAYVSAAFGFGQFWNSTNRLVTVAGSDNLHASFDAQDIAGRVEAGYHMFNVAAPFVVTPYAAVQPQTFSTPTYTETATSGSPQFALTYGAHTSTSVRTEVGSWANQNVSPNLNVFGRLAWVHDDSGSPALGASFAGLPAAGSFTVTGAKPGSERGLFTFGGEWQMAAGWALLGRVDAEAGANISSVTATARVRYTW